MFKKRKLAVERAREKFLQAVRAVNEGKAQTYPVSGFSGEIHGSSDQKGRKEQK
jgi:hypothetical protein